MQRFLLIIVVVVLCLFNNTYGQQTKYEYCGHDILLEANERLYPGYRQNVNQFFNHIQEKLKYNSGKSSVNEVLRIPVVLHIVWKNEEENLSDEIIQSQIDVLNEDFRLMNANRDSIRDIFRERQTDAGIEFDLIMVKRIKTTANFNLSLTGLVDNVKRPANGGSKAEDTQKYLNIWVCKIQPIPFIGGQILGYAYPPAGLPNWPSGASAPSPDLDGVVIDYRTFGKNNPFPITIGNRTLYSEGRTATHEIGHYLGLRHIWGDGTLFGGSSCNEDDGISDTPNQGRQSQYDCDKMQNSCSDMNNDEPDMIENYMDYSDQNCQNAFTFGQVEHMRTVILSKRTGLISSTDMAHPSTPEKYLISPMPAIDHIIIQTTRPSSSNLPVLEILDQTGRNIFRQKVDLFEGYYLDISSLMHGMYLLRIIDNGQVYTRKLIK